MRFFLYLIQNMSFIIQNKGKFRTLQIVIIIFSLYKLSQILKMDNQANMQKYIMDINNELGDAQSLNPTQIVLKLQGLINSGLQNFVIQTIRTCIQHYSRDRAIIKYAHVIDKLLKLPVFNQIVQTVIVQFFCDIFIFLLIQKCYNQLDQLKILRKFWLKTIHPRHLQIMRDIILAQTTLDVDQYFKSEMINLLKNHYQKKLRLTPEEMIFHLPKTIKTSNVIYETKFIKTPLGQLFPNNPNPNYIITETPNNSVNFNVGQNFIRRSQSPEVFVNPTSIPPVYRRSQSPQSFSNNTNPQIYRNQYINKPQNYQYITSQNQYQTTEYPPNQPQNYQYAQKQMYPRINKQIPHPNVKNNLKYQVNYFPAPNQYVEPQKDFRDPRLNNQRKTQGSLNYYQQQNIPFYGDKKQFINENYKRQRLFSQETRSPNNSQYMMHQHPLQSMNTQFIKNEYEITEPQPYKRVNLSEKIENYVEPMIFNERKSVQRQSMSNERQPVYNNRQPIQSMFNENVINSSNGIKIPEKPKHQQILQKLMSDKIYKCKQCGRSFKIFNEYEKHTNDHFEQKLSIKEKRKRAQRLMNIDEWTLSKSNSTFQQFDQFYITVSNLISSNKDEQKQSKVFLYTQEKLSLQLQQSFEQKMTVQINQPISSKQPLQLKCKLCNQLFQIKFSRNQWVLNNATFCLIDNEKIPLHKTCQQVLEDSSSSNEYF